MISITQQLTEQQVMELLRQCAARLPDDVLRDVLNEIVTERYRDKTADLNELRATAIRARMGWSG